MILLTVIINIINTVLIAWESRRDWSAAGVWDILGVISQADLPRQAPQCQLLSSRGHLRPPISAAAMFESTGAAATST